MDIVTHDFFVLRRPFLSIDALLEFNNEVICQDNLIEGELVRIFSQKEILEAIYLSSPDLYRAFTDLVADQYKGNKKQLYKSLYKYLVRIASRSTPYGLFAGCVFGKIGTSSRISFNEHVPYNTHSRLDMNYVEEMTKSLLDDPNIRHQVKYYPNTSLFKAGNSFRYIESITQDKKRSYSLVAVKFNFYLNKIITLAREGMILQNLIKMLVSYEVSEENAAQYLDELIQAQLLVSELEVTVTGEEFYTLLIKKLEKLKGTKNVLQKLHDIEEILQQRNRDINKYREIKAIVDRNFVTTNSKDLVQTDLFYNTEACSLSSSFTSTVASDLKNLLPLAKAYAMSDLDDFKQRFYDQYGEQEMPLLSVIDNETGIGYGKVISGKADNLPLIENLKLPTNVRRNNIEYDGLLTLKHDLYQEAILNSRDVIQITDQLIASYRSETEHQPTLPDSFYLIGSIISSSTKSIDNNDFKFSIKAIAGPTGLKLLGRFCHGNKQLENEVRQAIKKEDDQYKEVIFAEIAHLPEARVGNILMRPYLRKFEIPYLAGSAADKEFQITPDDLLVSIRGDKVILRSKKLKKRVIPKLTNAHSFTRGLPCYKFLCDLGYQENNFDLNWTWSFLNNQPYLPRVEYKHLILSRATWNIDKKTIPGLKSDELKKSISNLREKLKLPRYVQLVEGDNELLLDLDFSLSQELLRDTLLKLGKVRLKEFLEEPKNCFLQDNKGKYTSEIVLPFFTKKENKTSVKLIPIQKNLVKRTFSIGSEWLYVKLYAGTKTIDQLLSSSIKPFVQRMLVEKVIDKWFFIRYYDSGYHIRLRFHNSQNKLFWQTVIQELNHEMQSYPQWKLIQKVQTDTYEREIERYGSTTIEQIETIFFADSQAIVKLLDLLVGDTGERYRWLLALQGVDAILEDFGYSLDMKFDLCSTLRQKFFEEFNGNKKLHYDLNNRYRLFSKDIYQFMDKPNDSVFQKATKVFQERSVNNILVIKDIKRLLQLPLDRIVASIIHMHLNRLFVAKQRIHELIIYHYLSKYYKSKIARLKNNNKKSLNMSSSPIK